MRDSICRRGFIKQSTTLVALSAGATHSAEPEGKVLRIIDTHQHLWDLKRFHLPWLKKTPKLKKSYLMVDYLAATGKLAQSKKQPPAKVVKTIYMEVDVTPKQQQAEADYVTAVCKSGKTPMAAAVVSGRPAADGFAKYVKPFRDHPYVKGIRQVLHVPETPRGTCLKKNFVSGIRLLGDLGLSFDLCMRSAELADAAKLIDACPDTQFILDHCGNANVQQKDRRKWKKDVAVVARRKNVVCKVSGIVASADPENWKPQDLAPVVLHALGVFGPDRVMFGGDWPVCTLTATFRQWVDALRDVVADRKPQEQRKLFHDNAVRVYKLR